LTGERVERRLTAVLAADVAGYSRLMGGDEEGTLTRLKAVRKNLVDPTVAGNDQDVYLVLDNFGGRIGQSWREADVAATLLETVLADLLDGQYSNPVRVIAFNTAERWSRDVSDDVAHELRRRCAEQARDLPSSLEQFVVRYQGQTRAL
jgi:class 3 adenylate cyclase